MTTATATQTRYITKCFANGHTVQAARFADLHNGVWIKCPCGSYTPLDAPVKTWRCDDCGHEQDLPR